MKVELNGIQEISKVFHLSDIHIRLFDRHKEYKEVFDRIYELIEQHKDENSIAVVTGDIVHTKIELSPEAVYLTFDFFEKLSNIIPTFVIAGNHDCNVKNPDRMDALSPIINNIKSADLWYLKDTGVYEIADYTFSVMSIFTDPSEYILAKDIPGKKIALYHGRVEGSMNDLGYEFKTGDIALDAFDGFDYAILGDIHRMQYLDPGKRIAYAGSLIQQNFGEALRHGFLIWDLKAETTEFIQVPNEYGFYTVFVANPANVPDLMNIPVNAKVRIKHENDFDYAQKRAISEEIRSRHTGVREITYSKDVSQSAEDIEEQKNIILGDVKDTGYQFDLIKNYLEEEHSIDSFLYEKIKILNETCNSKIKSSDLAKNIIWEPGVFEFSNMFSYGSNNTIDFSRMEGVVGIFAPNAAGKSSVLDSFLYTLFDKTSRTSLAGSVMNTRTRSFNGKLGININGSSYTIERDASKSTDRTSVAVNFAKVLPSQQSLNGEQRKDTNANIRDYFGTYDNFVLTSLSTQNDNQGLIDMKQANRKEHFAQFMGIDIFEKLHDIAKSEVRRSKILLHNYKTDNSSNKLIDEEKQLIALTEISESQAKEKEILDTEIKKLNTEIIQLNKQLKPVQAKQINVAELETQQSTYSDQILETQHKMTDQTLIIEEIEKVIEEVETELSKYDPEAIKKNLDELREIESQKGSIMSELNRMKIIVENKVEKLDKIDAFEYDPECGKCVSNATIYDEDAVKTRDELTKDKETTDELIEQLSDANTKISELTIYKTQATEYAEKQGQIDDKQIESKRAENERDSFRNRIFSMENQIKEIAQSIIDYNQAKEDIENNKKLQDQLDVIEEKKQQEETCCNQLIDEITDAHGKIEVSKTLIRDYQDKIEKIESLEIETKAYDHYIEAVHRDGVPYNLLKNTIPHVEAEINNILEQMVDFRILLGMDGKDFDIKVSYDEDRTWPVELGSGFEKFISSVAIRSALLEISSLPRPNFLAIDEGFGVLDSENLTALNQLFDYLKTKYKFVLVISHLEMLRDMVDDFIEISKVSGYSNVIYN